MVVKDVPINSTRFAYKIAFKAAEIKKFVAFSIFFFHKNFDNFFIKFTILTNSIFHFNKNDNLLV